MNMKMKVNVNVNVERREDHASAAADNFEWFAAITSTFFPHFTSPSYTTLLYLHQQHINISIRVLVYFTVLSLQCSTPLSLQILSCHFIRHWHLIKSAMTNWMTPLGLSWVSMRSAPLILIMLHVGFKSMEIH